ncbi:hypothetical protein BDB00DRAFT_510350 [Zychaea mexicana]|uniref:uncharacterized protein n=1 Tax=Zychaea mexicana TaxID=64656 RepID=UPI0022FDB554|nr:uncharacterized protein BDB00DRAFT_510350 [Zychaea mexicana]KAI9491330.1 hypothetical protein BDB00DRAFT_510350 [Zychaea mexicana]
MDFHWLLLNSMALAYGSKGLSRKERKGGVLGGHPNKCAAAVVVRVSHHGQLYLRCCRRLVVRGPCTAPCQAKTKTRMRMMNSENTIHPAASLHSFSQQGKQLRNVMCVRKKMPPSLHYIKQTRYLLCLTVLVKLLLYHFAIRQQFSEPRRVTSSLHPPSRLMLLLKFYPPSQVYAAADKLARS